MRKVIIFLFTPTFLLLLIALRSYAHADWPIINFSTQVANTTGVINWAEQITADLERTGSFCNYYNRLMKPPTITNGSYVVPNYSGSCDGKGGGTYFCTLLVRDSYKLAGLPYPTNDSTCGQIRQWAGLPGYRIVRNDLRQVKAGDAVYWSTTTDEGGRDCGTYGFTHHTNMVYNLRLDQNGTGGMTTIDSNNVRTRQSNYSIQNWQVVGRPFGWCSGNPYCNVVPWFGLAPAH